MICDVCGKTDAQYRFIDNKWVCHNCGDFKISATEFTSQEIKDNRVKYFNSIVQPYRNGKLSKEYVDAHGTKGIDATPEEVAKARDVWTDTPGYSTRKKSK